MKKYFLIIIALAGLPWLFWPFSQAAAMPLGTLLYRTSSDGKIYGYSDFELLKINNGILSDLYTGHVGIYVGQENGVDYVVDWDDGSQFVSGAIELLKPNIFAKGGDRAEPKDIPEWDICQQANCQVVFGVGGGKIRSSSELVAQAGNNKAG